MLLKRDISTILIYIINIISGVYCDEALTKLNSKRAIESIPVETSQMKNERSILSGRMSRELVKEISEYVYNLLRGKTDGMEDLVAHSPYYKQKKTEEHSPDYKDYMDMMDERKPSRSPMNRNRPVAFVKQYNGQNSRMKYRYGVSRRYTKSTLPSQFKRRSFSRFRRLGQ
ncbi:unnamed protein product [Auanema sp. JU1783]|nr:unnamed protein product [Auanema sp. JU1783]